MKYKINYDVRESANLGQNFGVTWP